MKKIFLILAIIPVFLGSILIYQNITYNHKKLHVVFCDVGQGDAIFIRTPNGSDILVDGGPDDAVLSCLGKHMPFWDRTIETIILTHPHADHLTGLIGVIKRYTVLSFNTEKLGHSTGVYNELIKQIEKNHIKQRFLYQDDKFVIKDGVILKTLWPTRQWLGEQTPEDKNLDLNGLSVILLLSYKNFKVLLTGDAGSIVEDKIAQFAENVNVLKVPHHGSRTGMSSEFLDIVNPKLAVISVGKKNKYGHPAPFTLQLLEEKEIRTLRTDQNGEIEITSDGNVWKVQ